MKPTRRQKVAYQQRGASMRAMDAQARGFERAIESGELVVRSESGDLICPDDGDNDQLHTRETFDE